MLCYRLGWTACNLLLYWILWVPGPGIRLNDFYFLQNPVTVFKDLCPPKVSFFRRHCQLNYKYASLTLAWPLVVVVPGILAKVQGQSFFLKSSWVYNRIFSIRALFLDKDSDLVPSSLKVDSLTEFKARKFRSCFLSGRNLSYFVFDIECRGPESSALQKSWKEQKEKTSKWKMEAKIFYLGK